MNEWGFAAEIKSWWDTQFSLHPEWQLLRCEVEHKQEPDRKRVDLSIMSGGMIQLCGEIRLPDHPQASPWHPDNLMNVIEKATLRGCRWAFTSDATLLLLVDTHLSGPPSTRVVQKLELVTFSSRRQLDSESFLSAVRSAWMDAICKIAPIVAGISSPPGMTADEAFVNSLGALLAGPVAAIRHELNTRRVKDSGFETRLIAWMVDEQGWDHLPNRWEEEVQRAAQLTAYVFTTRLLFYEALRRSKPSLRPLSIPRASAKVVRATIREYFQEAKDFSGDYETLFAWDSALEFALLPDISVDAWRRVIKHLAGFDLSAISYDVLGKIFERLIDPHERYRWGQHYTLPDVVDLMLSLAIPDGIGKILDPAAGGGTFLVRAYARKRWREPAKTHEELLEDLYGVDVSAFAASLSTVNLAIRRLDSRENYPQIAVKSFFQVEPNETFMALPSPHRLTLGLKGDRSIAIDRVRAVVCNPPYVRIHNLGRERQEEATRVLRHRHNRVPVPAKLHGLSNYHVYFWLHAAQFLEPNGRLVLITSGEWLDSDYGAALQEWLLDHFAIECVIESLAEPWFSEARVGTVVVAARLTENPHRRSTNLVRFVLLRRPLRALYGESSSEEEHLARVDALRERILGLTDGTGETDDFDWSVVQQSELFRLGTAVGG